MSPPAGSQQLPRSEPPSSFEVAAAQLCALAERIAGDYRHDYLGTEHLLLAVLDAYPDAAAAFLGRYRVTPRQVREAVAEEISPGPRCAPRGELPLTPRLGKVLGLAATLAPRWGDHDFVAVILLSLAHGSGGTAAAILADLGVREEAVRALAAELDGADDVAPPATVPADYRVRVRRPVGTGYLQPVGPVGKRLALLACLGTA